MAARQNADEAWEANSAASFSSASDCDSDVYCARLQQPEVLAGGRSTWTNEDDSTGRSVRSGRSFVPAAAVSTKSTGPRAPQEGLVEVVAQLRRDNIRLRKALVAAQREAEDLAMAGEAHKLDFGHLLSLVRDFGEELLVGDDIATRQPASPRESDRSTSCESGTGTNSPQVFNLDDSDDEFGLCGGEGPKKPVLMDSGRPASAPSRKELARLRRQLGAAQREADAAQKEAEHLRAQLVACPASA